MSEIKKEIDLSGLPMKTYRGREVIDWIGSAGCKCKFVYDDIKGEVKIIRYETNEQVVVFKYGNTVRQMKFNNFKQCRFGKILGKMTNEFKVEIETKFKDDKRDLIIIDREYRNGNKGHKWKWYKYKCNKCGWDEGWMEESHILKGYGCSCCYGRTAVPGINDIATTDPWIIKYLVNKEDAYKYTSNSHKKIYPKCPDCGRVKDKPMKIDTIYKRKSIGCNCSDGISYPNKFMFAILEELNIEFITEYSPSWLDSKRFDFYIPSINLIIEMDGGLGHGNNIHSRSTYTKNETIELDKWKDNQAELHNITVVRIDCFYKHVDKFEYIRNSVLNSKLNNYFDLNIIDWVDVENKTTINTVKSVCEYYNRNKNNISMKEMANYFNIHRSTLKEYLERGTKLNWCDYKKYKNIRIKSIEVFKDNVSLGTYDSPHYIEKNSVDLFGIHLGAKYISLVCKGKQKLHKGFYFKYVNNDN